MSKKLRLLVYCTSLFSCLHTLTAQNPVPQPLTIVLESIQEQYGVQFNYASDLVESIKVVPPGTTLSLSEVLTYLDVQSNLNYEQLSGTIISIKEKDLSLCGYLKDEDTGESVPFVTVQYDSLGVIANKEGYFSIDSLTKNNQVVVRHLGFKPLVKNVKLFDVFQCDTLFLIPYQEELAEVTVSDFFVRGIDKLENGSYQMNFNKFSLLPGLIDDDVLQSVQALPGIQSIDETVSNINIRGGSNDQNLILWDDIKMYQSGHFFGLISMFNPQITRRVQLIKNGSSVSDTDGVSGTISMKTDEYLNYDTKGSVGLNLIDFNGSVDTPIGKRASIQFATRRSLSDFIETPTFTNYFDRAIQDTEIGRNFESIPSSDLDFNFYDVSMRLLYDPSDKDRIRLNFIHTSNNLSFNEVADIDGVLEERESGLDQGTTAFGIYYRRDWTENFGTDVNLYNTDYGLDARNANILDNQQLTQENTVSETSLRLNTRLRVTDRLKLTSGYQYMETKVSNSDNVDNPLFVRLDARVLRTHALFSEVGVLSPDQKTRQNLGMRFNYLDAYNKIIFEPRISLDYTFLKHFNVEFLGEFKHQSTSQIINFQNDFLGLEKRRWQLADNREIPVIRSRQASVGFSYNQKGWLANVVPYYKRVLGITTQSQGFQDQYEFVRTPGSYDAFGVDVLMRKQLKNNAVWLNYSYLNAEYTFGQLAETQFASNFDITHAVTVGGNYTWKKILVSAGVNWRTGRPLSQPVWDNPVVNGAVNYAAANAGRLRDYLRADISGRYEFDWGKTRKVQVGMSVWNLLNRDNTLNTYYRATSPSEATAFVQSALGITPNASVRVLF